MNRSMFMSVAILAVLGILVVVSIMRGDDPEPDKKGPDGASKLQIETPGAGGTAGGEGADASAGNAGRAGGGPSDTDRAPAVVDTNHETAGRSEGDDRRPSESRDERPVDPSWKAAVAGAQRLIDAGKFEAGIAQLSRAYRKSSDRAQRKYWRRALAGWAKLYILRPMDKTGFYSRYQVQSGDSFIRIAKTVRSEAKINADAMFIQDINRISDPRRLRLGRRLFVPTRNQSIDVMLSDFRLDVYFGDCLMASYEAGIGKEGTETPIADFVVGTKIDEPDWFFDGRTIPYGNEENELGERWIGIEHDLYNGFGIHGTNDETTVGKAVSRGCVRLRNKEVIELYRRIAPRTKVSIRQ